MRVPYRDELVALRWQDVALEVALRRSAGPGETVLFVHGLACTKESFDGAWERPLAKRRSLVALDLPGFGASSRPRAFSYTMEDQAAILLDVLDHVGAEQVHVVAHSMGGAPALLLARQLGGRLASFINVEGNLVPEDCGMISRRTAQASFERFERVGLPALRTAVRESEEAAMRQFAGWLEQADQWAFWRSSVSLVDWSDGGELLRLFRELSVPHVYLYGEQSVLEAVRSQLADVECFGVPQSGHFVMQDAPDAFWSIVERVVLGWQGSD